jgi:predicted DNA-binding transcriptional regulator AlpA
MRSDSRCRATTRPVADPDRLRVLDPPPLASAVEPASPPRLLWGWPEILAATGLIRRTIERELSAGRFPKPIRRVGRRPYWRPTDVIRWAEGGKP